MAYRNKKQQKEINTKRRHTECETGPPVITVDYERYAHMLDDSDLTEDQKREFCQTLWNIVVEFVSLGFGVHPLQQVQKPCGKLGENSSNSALTAPDTVYLDQSILDNFDNVANLKPDMAAQRTKS